MLNFVLNETGITLFLEDNFQRGYVPTPLRATITIYNHIGTNPNLSNKKFDLRQSSVPSDLHNVKEFDLFEKYVN